MSHSIIFKLENKKQLHIPEIKIDDFDISLTKSYHPPPKLPEIPPQKKIIKKLKKLKKAKRRKGQNMLKILYAHFCQNHNEFISQLLIFLNLLLSVGFVALLTLAIMVLQEHIADYCFYEDFCPCVGLDVKIFTFLKEFILFDLGSMQVTYYIIFYLSNTLHANKNQRKLFFILCFVYFGMAYYIFFCLNQKTAMHTIRLTKLSLYSVVTLIYYSFLLKKFNLWSKRFFILSLKLICLTLYGVFHEFYIKTVLSFSWFKFLEKYNDQESSKNLFKVSTILYFQLYQTIFKIIVYSFYKHQKEENLHDFYSVFHFNKYIMVETRTAKIINAITISLNDVFGILSIFIYVSTMVSDYTNFSLKNLFFKYVAKKSPQIDEDFLSYKLKLKECGFELNLIIIIRVFILKYFGRFFHATRFIEIYKNCCFEIKSTNELIMTNIILIIGLHFFIYVLLAFFNSRKKDKEKKKEEFNVPFLVLLCSYLSLNMFIDSYIQIFLRVTVFTDVQ